MKSLIICAIFIFIQLTVVLSECKFPTPHSAENRIAPLEGHSWSAKDDTGEFAYTVAICTTAEKDQPALATAGVVQTEVSTKKMVKIGDIHSSYVKGGDSWVYLEYRKGQPYGHHCGKENRTAHIMLLCDKQATQGKLKVIEENKNGTQECYYLFELSHAIMCAEETYSAGLSSGSIFCIVFITVVGLYMLVGFVYQRLVVGAKGWEQVPNYSFWQDFGNLQADGCDFICRTKSKSVTREYRGIGDDQLQDEDIGRDDSLLPM